MSFGSAIGALVSLNNNRRKRTARSSKHLAGSEIITGITSHRTPTQEELLAIRKKINLEHKKRQHKIIMISAAFFMVLLAVLLYFLLWF